MHLGRPCRQHPVGPWLREAYLHTQTYVTELEEPQRHLAQRPRFTDQTVPGKSGHPPKPQDQGQNRVRAGPLSCLLTTPQTFAHMHPPRPMHTRQCLRVVRHWTHAWCHSSSRRSPRRTRARASPARSPAVHGHLLTQRPISRRSSHFFKARYPFRYLLSLHTTPEGSSQDPDPPWGARGSAQSSDPSRLHSRRPHSAIPPAHLPLP